MSPHIATASVVTPAIDHSIHWTSISLSGAILEVEALVKIATNIARAGFSHIELIEGHRSLHTLVPTVTCKEDQNMVKNFSAPMTSRPCRSMSKVV